MGANTLFRLVLVFSYCVIGFDKTNDDIFQTGLNNSPTSTPTFIGFFVYSLSHIVGQLFVDLTEMSRSNLLLFFQPTHLYIHTVGVYSQG